MPSQALCPSKIQYAIKLLFYDKGTTRQKVSANNNNILYIIGLKYADEDLGYVFDYVFAQAM